MSCTFQGALAIVLWLQMVVNAKGNGGGGGKSGGKGGAGKGEPLRPSIIYDLNSIVAC